MISEREHHNEFYQVDGSTILDSNIFLKVHHRFSKLILAREFLHNKSQLLSLGAGNARIEQFLAPHVGHIKCVEISDVAVAQTTLRLHTDGVTNITMMEGDIDKLEPEQNKYDGVLAIAVLHHMDQKTLFNQLTRSYASLKPGGVFVSSDPSEKRLVAVFKTLVSRKYDKYHSPDEKEMSATMLTEQMKKCGFENIVVQYSDFFVGPLAWAWPNCPPLVSNVAIAIDHLLLRIPILNRFASSFSVFAKKSNATTL